MQTLMKNRKHVVMWKFLLQFSILVFNADGRLIEDNSISIEQSVAYGSCSTMLNGDAYIFGGFDDTYNSNKRQVHFK